VANTSFSTLRRVAPPWSPLKTRDLALIAAAERDLKADGGPLTAIKFRGAVEEACGTRRVRSAPGDP
jgi:hypothetical protein